MTLIKIESLRTTEKTRVILDLGMNAKLTSNLKRVMNLRLRKTQRKKRLSLQSKITRLSKSQKVKPLERNGK
jgi:hypothetical protein